MNHSIWLEASHAPEFKALKTDARTDVLIIGGGIAGILCAYMPQQAGVGYMLVEALETAAGSERSGSGCESDYSDGSEMSAHGMCAEI